MLNEKQLKIVTGKTSYGNITFSETERRRARARLKGVSMRNLAIDENVGQGSIVSTFVSVQNKLARIERYCRDK